MSFLTSSIEFADQLEIPVFSDKKYVICDIDGCLVDSSGRARYYFSGEYDKYFSRVHEDLPIPQGVFVYRAFYFDPQFHLLFITSRRDDKRYRQQTLDQLRQWVGADIHDHQLLMRTKDYIEPNRVPDREYKWDRVMRLGLDPKQIFMAFDDTLDVVEMWRSNGIVAYHTQHNPNAH